MRLSPAAFHPPATHYCCTAKAQQAGQQRARKKAAQQQHQAQSPGHRNEGGLSICFCGSCKYKTPQRPRSSFSKGLFTLLAVGRGLKRVYTRYLRLLYVATVINTLRQLFKCQTQKGQRDYSETKAILFSFQSSNNGKFSFP